MSLSTNYLEHGRHLGQLCCRRRAHAPTSNTAGHDNHEKINAWVSFSFLYECGAPLGGPWSRQNSAIDLTPGVLTIYMGKPKIPVGKSNGSRHSVWEASENMGCDLGWCYFSALISLSS